jgi:hypothetical protein
MVVNAIVLINAERGEVNNVAQHVMSIDGVSEVFRWPDDLTWWLCCVRAPMNMWPIL